MSLQNSPPRFNVDSTDTRAPYVFNTKVMIGAIGLLLGVICFILVLHVYARWFLRRSSRSYFIRQGRVAPAAQPSISLGLDKATISQLPTFVYTAASPVDNSDQAGKSHQLVGIPAPECSVCLSEFQENDEGRMLPSCKHIFHTECIDMWLFSHSTCPLCRTNIVPATATTTESRSTEHQHQQEAMEPSQGTTQGNSATEYPCNVLFWGNHMQVVSSQEPPSSSLPVSRVAGARALSQITIDIPPIEGNGLVSASGCLSAKRTIDQEAGSSHPLKSPSLRASIKRMLSRQSSRHKSPRQEGNEEISPK